MPENLQYSVLIMAGDKTHTLDRYWAIVEPQLLPLNPSQQLQLPWHTTGPLQTLQLAPMLGGSIVSQSETRSKYQAMEAVRLQPHKRIRAVASSRPNPKHVARLQAVEVMGILPHKQ